MPLALLTIKCMYREFFVGTVSRDGLIGPTPPRRTPATVVCRTWYMQPNMVALTKPKDRADHRVAIVLPAFDGQHETRERSGAPVYRRVIRLAHPRSP